MAMHTAARICGACEGGQILVSLDVWKSAGAERECVGDELGPVVLKGIFERCRCGACAGIPRRAPSTCEVLHTQEPRVWA